MSVNYNDERFTQVENEKQSELNKYNQTYDNLINERNQFTNQQQDLVNQWENTQKQIANDNLNHQIDLYNQQKEKAEQEYQKEANASYIDYLKETSNRSVNKQQELRNGLSNSGFSESSKVDMYNTYQNRVATARKGLNDAKLEFDNAIKEAQLQNNATLAENALTALQQKLNIALEGFNYKTEQENNKLNWNYNINNNYYNRYKDVESQINYENEQAEAIRQFNEQMAYQREQAALEQQRWEQELAYQKQQDAISNSQKWYELQKNYENDDTPELTHQVITDYYQGDLNQDTKYGTFGTKDKNGINYQPNNVSGNKLKSTGKKVSDWFGAGVKTGSSGASLDNQTVWQTTIDGKKRYFVWDGSQNKYFEVYK